MRVFQASILETLNKLADQQQSLREEIKSVAKPPSSEMAMDQITASVPKPDTSQQSDLIIQPSSKPSDELMDTELAGPPLPPQFIQRFESEVPLEGNFEK